MSEHKTRSQLDIKSILKLENVSSPFVKIYFFIIKLHLHLLYISFIPQTNKSTERLKLMCLLPCV